MIFSPGVTMVQRLKDLFQQSILPKMNGTLLSVEELICLSDSPECQSSWVILQTNLLGCRRAPMMFTSWTWLKNPKIHCGLNLKLSTLNGLLRKDCSFRW